MNKERYKEEYKEVSELLWKREKEDKTTKKFYRDLSHLSKITNYSKKNKLILFEQIIIIIKGKARSINIQKK